MQVDPAIRLPLHASAYASSRALQRNLEIGTGPDGTAEGGAAANGRTANIAGQIGGASTTQQDSPVSGPTEPARRNAPPGLERVVVKFEARAADGLEQHGLSTALDRVQRNLGRYLSTARDGAGTEQTSPAVDTEA